MYIVVQLQTNIQYHFCRTLYSTTENVKEKDAEDNIKNS